MDWKKGVDHTDVLFGVINIIETLGGLKELKMLQWLISVPALRIPRARPQLIFVGYHR